MNQHGAPCQEIKLMESGEREEEEEDADDLSSLSLLVSLILSTSIPIPSLLTCSAKKKYFFSFLFRGLTSFSLVLVRNPGHGIFRVFFLLSYPFSFSVSLSLSRNDSYEWAS